MAAARRALDQPAHDPPRPDPVLIRLAENARSAVDAARHGR